MKNRSGHFGRIVLVTTVVLIVACLPVVPVLEGAVVPNPDDRWRLVCILQIVASEFLAGIRLKATWMTLPAVITLVVLAVAVARSLDRRLFGGTKRVRRHAPE